MRYKMIKSSTGSTEQTAELGLQSSLQSTKCIVSIYKALF